MSYLDVGVVRNSFYDLTKGLQSRTNASPYSVHKLVNRDGLKHVLSV